MTTGAADLPPQRLVVVRERVDEVERMLKALSARFPRTSG